VPLEILPFCLVTAAYLCAQRLVTFCEMPLQVPDPRPNAVTRLRGSGRSESTALRKRSGGSASAFSTDPRHGPQDDEAADACARQADRLYLRLRVPEPQCKLFKLFAEQICTMAEFCLRVPPNPTSDCVDGCARNARARCESCISSPTHAHGQLQVWLQAQAHRI
jgi:hypothetical protein